MWPSRSPRNPTGSSHHSFQCPHLYDSILWEHFPDLLFSFQSMAASLGVVGTIQRKGDTTAFILETAGMILYLQFKLLFFEQSHGNKKSSPLKGTLQFTCLMPHTEKQSSSSPLGTKLWEMFEIGQGSLSLIKQTSCTHAPTLLPAQGCSQVPFLQFLHLAKLTHPYLPTCWLASMLGASPLTSLLNNPLQILSQTSSSSSCP